MDGFGFVFGALLVGLVAGVIAYELSGENAVIGWLVALAAGGTMFWKLLTEDT